MNKITIFFIPSFDDNYIYKDVQRVVKLAVDHITDNALRKYEIELITLDNIPFTSVAANVLHYIQKADLIISNLSSITPNVMYEVGISHALNKPTLILVDNSLPIPFDLSYYRYFTYDIEILKTNSLIQKLSNTIDDAIKHPDDWIMSEKQRKVIDKQKTVFVSYSHCDTDYLNRLKVHLKPLERRGSIQL